MAILPKFVSRNGVLISAGEASISIFNPAIYGAYGVYESIQVRNAIVFERMAHLRRLAYSAQVIGLPLPGALRDIDGWLDGLLAVSADRDCVIRLFVVGPDDGGEACTYLWTQPPARHAAAYYTQGAHAVTFEAQRYLPQSKSLNTLTSFMAQRAAKAAGVHEALLHHGGHVTEGSNSNVFAVIDGALVTPPGEMVLSGVTRDIVLRLAREAGLPVREALLPLAGLPEWRESFITSTSRHIMPVSAIDGRPVGSGQPGSVTQHLAGLFEQYFAAQTGDDEN